MKDLTFKVEVTLVSVQGLVESDDERGSVLEGSTWPWLVRLISHAVLAGAGARGEISGSTRKDEPGEDESREIEANRFLESSVRRDVFKFVQVKDRYMSLVSLLLKSRAYHQSTTRCYSCDSATVGPTSAARGGPRKALVVLPRTPHGKPYLPTPTSNDADRVAFQSLLLPFNVSHQYPVVGIAHLGLCSRGISSSSDIVFGSKLQIGFDVVMFDPYPARLYQSAVEFVEAFRDKLTCAEWEHLMGMASNGTELLREFFLHWAIKEAYTKAIGVGLGYDFSSLCVTLTEIDRSNGSKGSSKSAGMSYGDYFASFVNSGSTPTLVPATVHLLTEKRTEMWRVALHPIFCRETNRALQDHSRPRTLADVAGCFCVFVGGGDVKSDAKLADVQPELEVDWLDLDDLVHFHTMQKEPAYKE
jgi:phosphopantetheinyl transferase